MNTCRLCGVIGTVGEDVHRAPRNIFWQAHISELCPRCNDQYNRFFASQYGQGKPWWEVTIYRDERILVAFIAHKLAQLARRHAAGKLITRCQVMKRTANRCFFLAAVEQEGRQVCGFHSRAMRRGTRFQFSTDDAYWMDEVIAFFSKNGMAP